MKQLGMAVALACLMSGFVAVDAQESEEDTYVPRSERDTTSTFTFKGSGKGLVIIDHESGEVTRYTTKRQSALHRMTPEAEASARSAWETRQEAAAEYDAEVESEDDEKSTEDTAKGPEASAPAGDDGGSEDEEE